MLSSQQGVWHIIASEKTVEEPQYTGVLPLDLNKGGARLTSACGILLDLIAMIMNHLSV